MTTAVSAQFSSTDLEAVRNRLSNALVSPQNIAPMPRVCAQIADLAEQPRTDAMQLVRVIQTDPALVGEVMRVANSPAMRLRSSASSLHQAVSWLGISEVRNIALARALRGEVFSAPGRDKECEQLWREAWLGALWAREAARQVNRRHLETSFLSGLMHRTGAALAFKIISRFEKEKHLAMGAADLEAMIGAVEPSFCRLLTSNWRLTAEVQDAASGWSEYPDGVNGELVGIIAAAHLLAVHTLRPEQVTADAVLGSRIFAALGASAEDRAALLAKRDEILKSAEF
ncbi:MAG: HDOD domain-containing protein [Steroidobacterales bacterium]